MNHTTLKTFESKEIEAYLKALELTTILSVSDLNGNILYVNKKFEQAFGIRAEESVGLNYRQFNSGLHEKDFFAKMWERILKQEIWVGEICNKTTFGEYVWFNTTIIPILNEQKELDKFITIRNDISELKNQQIENWRQLQLQSTINQISNNVVIQTDIYGGITYLNSVGKDLVLNDLNTFEGKNIIEIFLPNELYEIKQEIENTYQEENLSLFEALIYNTKKGIKNDKIWTLNKDKSNERKIRFQSKNFFDRNQEITGFIWVGIDVTDIKKSEERLNESKVFFEKSNEMKKFLLSKLSHEIKTPLNGILGMVDLLENTNIDSEQKDYLDSIYKSSMRIYNLASNVIEWNKFQENLVELNDVKINLNLMCLKLFKDSISCLQHESISTNINFQLSHENYYVDGPRLEFILHTMLQNSVKFTKKGNIQFNIKEDSDRVLFEIIDTGIGIRNEKKQVIFEEFNQGHLQVDSMEGGGVSLSLCKLIIDKMNGEIVIDSEEDIGTTIKIYLPLHKASSSDNTNLNLKKETKENLKYLIVEDDQINSRLLKKLLNKYNIFPDIATNGKEALLLQEKNHYNIIFMDINMPIMDGLTASRCMRENQALYGVPYLIAVTANTIMGDLSECLKAGMDDYITKPIKKDLLIASLNKISGINLSIEEIDNDIKFFIKKLIEDYKGDEEILGIFIDKVLEEYPKKIELLQKAFKEKDKVNIIKLCRNLSSIMRNLHLDASQNMLNKILERAELEIAPELENLIKEMIEETNKHIEELEKYFFKKVV